MGHRPEMVKISPACVGHNKNLSPLENILLLLFVAKVQSGARTSRLASKGFGEKNRVATVREKILDNEKFSRSGKSQGITFSVREILNK